MDAYLGDYLGSLLTGRPFVSLIISYDGSDIAVGGRALIDGEWRAIDRVAAERMPQVVAWPGGERPAPPPQPPESVPRLTSAVGLEAYKRPGTPTVHPTRPGRPTMGAGRVGEE